MKTIDAKVVVVGPQGVGKTSVSTRFVENNFSRHVTPTVGASFISTKITLDDTTVRLQVWDTAGQERFKSMTPLYYRNANAAIAVFDLSYEMSFIQCKTCVKDLLRHTDYPMCMRLVGNKSDLTAERQVKREDAENYAYSINARYFETSALTEEGIHDLFRSIAEELVAKQVEDSSRASDTISLPTGANSEIEVHRYVPCCNN